MRWENDKVPVDTTAVRFIGTLYLAYIRSHIHDKINEIAEFDAKEVSPLDNIFEESYREWRMSALLLF